MTGAPRVRVIADTRHDGPTRHVRPDDRRARPVRWRCPRCSCAHGTDWSHARTRGGRQANVMPGSRGGDPASRAGKRSFFLAGERPDVRADPRWHERPAVAEQRSVKSRSRVHGRLTPPAVQSGAASPKLSVRSCQSEAGGPGVQSRNSTRPVATSYIAPTILICPWFSSSRMTGLSARMTSTVRRTFCSATACTNVGFFEVRGPST